MMQTHKMQEDTAAAAEDQPLITKGGGGSGVGRTPGEDEARSSSSTRAAVARGDDGGGGIRTATTPFEVYLSFLLLLVITVTFFVYCIFNDGISLVTIGQRDFDEEGHDGPPMPILPPHAPYDWGNPDDPMTKFYGNTTEPMIATAIAMERAKYYIVWNVNLFWGIAVVLTLFTWMFFRVATQMEQQLYSAVVVGADEVADEVGYYARWSIWFDRRVLLLSAGDQGRGASSSTSSFNTSFLANLFYGLACFTMSVAITVMAVSWFLHPGFTTTTTTTNTLSPFCFVKLFGYHPTGYDKVYHEYTEVSLINLIDIERQYQLMCYQEQEKQKEEAYKNEIMENGIQQGWHYEHHHDNFPRQDYLDQYTSNRLSNLTIYANNHYLIRNAERCVNDNDYSYSYYGSSVRLSDPVKYSEYGGSDHHWIRNVLLIVGGCGFCINTLSGVWLLRNSYSKSSGAGLLTVAFITLLYSLNNVVNIFLFNDMSRTTVLVLVIMSVLAGCTNVAITLLSNETEGDHHTNNDKCDEEDVTERQRMIVISTPATSTPVNTGTSQPFFGLPSPFLLMIGVQVFVIMVVLVIVGDPHRTTQLLMTLLVVAAIPSPCIWFITPCYKNLIASNASTSTSTTAATTMLDSTKHYVPWISCVLLTIMPIICALIHKLGIGFTIGYVSCALLLVKTISHPTLQHVGSILVITTPLVLLFTSVGAGVVRFSRLWLLLFTPIYFLVGILIICLGIIHIKYVSSPHNNGGFISRIMTKLHLNFKRYFIRAIILDPTTSVEFSVAAEQELARME